MTDISIIIPVFNEEKNIPQLYQRLKKTISQLSPHYEYIFVNDGSTDHTLTLLKTLRKKDKKIKIISFSRNFGHMPALDAGLAHTKGKKIVFIDADLQDPPEIIKKMYQKASQGYDVVYGTKIKRKESPHKVFLFNTFYKIMNQLSYYKMPANTGTFSLIDRKVANVIISLPERNKYFSGIRAWAGFSQTGITYQRASRYRGKEKSIISLFRLAMDGILSFSYVPLKIASFLGFIFAGLAFIFILFVIFGRLFFGLGIIGWASTISTVLLIGGIQLITLGIIGEYLARIYEEVKNRPNYVISEKIGLH